MSKKLLAFVFTVILMFLLCACTSKAQTKVDLAALYTELTGAEGGNEMILVKSDKAQAYFGIDPADCLQEVTAICSESILADEVWLIEAKDEAAAKRIIELAEARLAQKGDELREYLPEQFKVVENAKLDSHGNYVWLLVSQDADRLLETVSKAFTG